MPMSRDLREFVECLNSNGAEYLIVGALAVSWHGFPRYSGDIDFLVRPVLENAFEAAWETRVSGKLDGLPVFFIGKDALLKNKESTGRSKDKIDADQLRRQPPRE